MRVKINLAYDGSRYHGFQVQKGDKQTVAGELYEAFQSLHIPGTLAASGRTDANVHASSQIIHIDLPDYWTDLTKLHRELTKKLSGFIQIKYITPVDESFHARFGAKRRVYRYIMTDKRPTAFENGYVTYVPALSVDRISAALALIEGTHDFLYFQKSGSESKSTIRTIHRASLYQYRGYTVLRFEANSFLRSQIRMLVGFLLKISDGKLDIDQLQEQLALQKQHSRSLADPNGLYLAKIIY